MKRGMRILAFVVLSAILLISVPPARLVQAGTSDDPTGETDSMSVLVLAPKTIYAGTPAAVSVTTMKLADKSPVCMPVRARLKIDSSTSMLLFSSVTDEQGRLTAHFGTPDLEPGAYSLEVEVRGLAEPLTTDILVRRMPVLLIETDKPIYKPGQTIKGRVLVLTNNLKPASEEVSVEITDGKGVKIFREVLAANSFGVAPFELDLASELNYGTWKITAESGASSGSLDVRVEEYVLPRFNVECVTERDYFLVDEEVVGTIKAEYFFGKPVDGTVLIRASRYVGVWEEYATYTGTLSDGSVDFVLPPVGYTSGTSGAGGAGSAQLEVTVSDTSDHEEETTKLLKITGSIIQHQVIAASQSLTPERPFDVMLVAQSPDGDPLTVSTNTLCEYYDRYNSLISTETISRSNVNGSVTITLTPPAKTSWARLQSSAENDDGKGEGGLILYAAYSPSDSFLHLSRPSDTPVDAGDTVEIDVFRTHNSTIYYDVFANGRTVFSGAEKGSEILFQATPEMMPAAKVVAYIINPNNEVSADTLAFEVAIHNPAELNVQFDAGEVLPGDAVKVSVQADTEAMVGIAIVDESVYALNKNRLNMQEVFEELERRFMEPQFETHEERYSTPGAYEVFDRAGLQGLASGSLQVPQGSEFGWWWWLADVALGGGRNGPPESSGGDAPLAEVTRVRQFFPETWLWTPDLLTEPNGSAEIDLTAPDSITTWRLHAVSTSNKGLGMAESELLVFQEFFGEPDLPYAVTRGERFPVRIQVFNYLDEPQLVHVELTDANWFDLHDEALKKV
ncbi:MAG: alpha-2-macroglobulin family protein, partial [Planctomycetota bacterium]